MYEMWMRFAENLVGRVDGPMHFRIFMQPIMAIFYAIYSGVKDAKADRPPYFWSLITMPETRKDMLRDGWKSVGKVFLLAVALDVIYQIMVEKFVYPGETIVVAIVLAIIPYLIIRGLVTRLLSLKSKA